MVNVRPLIDAMRARGHLPRIDHRQRAVVCDRCPVEYTDSIDRDAADETADPATLPACPATD